MIEIFALFVVILFPQTGSIINTNASLPGYYKWSPFNSTRDDLYCPDSCKRFLPTDSRKADRCCSCESLPCTQINTSACGVTVNSLHIERYDIFGRSVLISVNPADLYTLEHRNGHLTSFPVNLCDFADSLIKIDLSFNRISDISAVKCLSKLDTIIMDSNEISFIDNDTFTDMEYVRVVSIKSNNLERLLPQTNKNKHGDILQFDVSYNDMDYFDASNIFLTNVICNISCDGCQIIEQTNLLSIDVTEESYDNRGYGYYNFRNTTPGAWVNLSLVGVSDFTKPLKYLKGSYEYDNASIICDCSIYPLFSSADSVSRYYPFITQNVTCAMPEYMKGTDISSLFENRHFEELICHLPNCPYKCKCTDIPVREIVLVKCTEQTDLPDFMPIGHWNNDKIILDLSDNSNHITQIPEKSYLDRIISLNLSNNNIQGVEGKAIERIDRNSFISLDISDRRMTELPPSFYRLDPNTIHFGSEPVQCDCSNIWIGDWIRTHKVYNTLWCSTAHGVHLAESITREFLNCDDYDQQSPIIKPAIIIISIVACAIILGAIMAKFYRYELFLLKRRYINDRNIHDKCEFDAVISFSKDNDEIFEWISKTVIRRLEEEGYSLFVPYFNIPIGEDKERVTSNAIRNSKHYVVCICKQYLKDVDAVLEFDRIWNNFYKNGRKNLIVINWENLECSEISSKRLRAVCRIRDDLNFKDRNTKFFARLQRRLGPVRTALDRRKRVFGNHAFNENNDEESPRARFKQNPMFEGVSKHHRLNIQPQKQELHRFEKLSSKELNSNTRFKPTTIPVEYRGASSEW